MHPDRAHTGGENQGRGSSQDSWSRKLRAGVLHRFVKSLLLCFLLTGTQCTHHRTCSRDTEEESSLAVGILQSLTSLPHPRTPPPPLPPPHYLLPLPTLSTIAIRSLHPPLPSPHHPLWSTPSNPHLPPSSSTPIHVQEYFMCYLYSSAGFASGGAFTAEDFLVTMQLLCTL